MIGIYKIENLINGKVYIGQSSNIKSRWTTYKWIALSNNLPESVQSLLNYPIYQAFKKYGYQNFKFSVIEECSIKQLNEREVYWIKYYNSCILTPNNNGYNASYGGAGVVRTPIEKIEQIIQLWNQGKGVIEISKQLEIGRDTVLNYLQVFTDYTKKESKIRGVNKRKKPINRYNYKAELIKSYPSVIEAEKELNVAPSTLKKVLKLQTATFHDDYYVYANENQAEAIKQHMLLKLKHNKSNNTPVLQYDLNNNFIQRYNSLTNAAKALGFEKNTGNITLCCQGKINTAYGYIWKYENPLDYLKNLGEIND